MALNTSWESKPEFLTQQSDEQISGALNKHGDWPEALMGKFTQVNQFLSGAQIHVARSIWVICFAQLWSSG